MKGVQCYELFGGIALKNHTFSFFFLEIIIIMFIFVCYFSREQIALSLRKIKKRCEHRNGKNQQIKSSVHDAKYYMK